jgi:uncharacterized protein with HEPN domain
VRSDRARLLDVLDAIDVVARYLPPDRASFDNDAPVQSHIYRHIMIVGEACWRLSPPLKDANPQVPLRQIEGMRHVMVHDYFRVDWDIVFTTAQLHIPALRPHIEEMLRSLPPGSTASP